MDAHCKTAVQSKSGEHQYLGAVGLFRQKKERGKKRGGVTSNYEKSRGNNL